MKTLNFNSREFCKGISKEYKIGILSGKPYHYEVLEISKYTKSVGFNVVNDWNEKTVVKEWFEDDN